MIDRSKGRCRWMRRRLVPSILVAMVGLLIAVSGCGGSDSTAASARLMEGGRGIIKAELIRQGDAICRKTDEVQRAALAAYEKKHGKTTSFEEVETELVKAALPPIGREIEELEALRRPPGDEFQIEIILTELKKALKSAREHPNTLLGTGEGEFGKPDELAAIYGFKDCAKAL